jgi:hypothetical protein
VHVPGSVAGGGGLCLLGRRIEAAAGAAAAAAEFVPGAGIPGARTASDSGGGTRVVCGGLGMQERRRRQRSYLGADVAGSTGWRRRLVAEEGEGSYEISGGGGGTRVNRGGGGEHSGGCGQRAYLRGPGEAGDTGWWRRRLVLCGGGGSCVAAAAAAVAQKSVLDGAPGTLAMGGGVGVGSRRLRRGAQRRRGVSS